MRGSSSSMFYEEVPVFSNNAGVIMIEDERHNGFLRSLRLMLRILLSFFMWILSRIWRPMKTWSHAHPGKQGVIIYFCCSLPSQNSFLGYSFEIVAGGAQDAPA